jgi:hypothetical protein
MSKNKASDQLVTAKSILEAITEVKRRGRHRVLRDLEATEPELAGYVMEELTSIFHLLHRTGIRSKQLHRINWRMERMALVSIVAMRRAHYRLWRKSIQDTPLAKLDPPPDDDAGKPS